MKNSILTLLAVATLAACNKKETTAVDSSGDSMDMSAASYDSTEMVNDTANVSAGNAAENEMSNQDKQFVDAAAKGGMMEVMMGELASKNGTSADVKKLGEMMAADHSKANAELKTWATSVNYTLPTTLDAEQQKMHASLKSKKVSDFDRTYADMMVADHKKDVEAFKKQASEGTDPSLKSFAGKTLPTLEHHLMESEKIKNMLK